VKGPLVQEESATREVDDEDDDVLVNDIELEDCTLVDKVVLTLLVEDLVDVEDTLVVDDEVEAFLFWRAAIVPSLIPRGSLSTITAADATRAKAKQTERQRL
jgi:hypothetical protein